MIDRLVRMFNPLVTTARHSKHAAAKRKPARKRIGKKELRKRERQRRLARRKGRR